MTLDARIKLIDEVKTEFLFHIVVEVNPKLNFGNTPVGQRILYAAAGGKFEGPKLRGDVLAGGGDWAVFRPDGSMSLDVRLTLRTHDGALVYMTYGGRWVMPADSQTEMDDPLKRLQVEPKHYYFRINPLFETGAKDYSWLNNIVCIGQGYLVDGGVAYKVSRVL